MMKLKPIKINKIDSITLKVKIIITKRFKIRRIISLSLMKLALKIIPCNVNIMIERKLPPYLYHPNCRSMEDKDYDLN